ncbi:MAG: hypothetical protein WB507_07005 [Solirubrobacterales bacterium]
MRRAKIALLICASAISIAGCGGTAGVVGSGATVSVYVISPLCAAARRQLARRGGRVGKVGVRAICLPNPNAAGRLSLATIGADARRATEDSSTIGYLEPPDPAAARFSRPILESAAIASIRSSSGNRAMERLLGAIRESPSASRASVRAALEKR